MKKTLLLAGVALLMTTAAASAQFRRGGTSMPSTGVGVVTPFGTYGNSSFNNSYYSNPYNNGYNNFGYNQFNQPTYSQPYPGQTYSRNSYFSSPSTTTYPQYSTYRQGTVVYPQGTTFQQGTVVYPQGTVMQGSYVMPNGATNFVTPTAATSPATAMGLKVTEVKANGPAEKAGIHTNDVILKVDDKRTQTFDDLRSALTSTDKTDVKVEFWCEETGKKETKTVKVKDTKVGVMVVETPVNETKVN